MRKNFIKIGIILSSFLFLFIIIYEKNNTVLASIYNIEQKIVPSPVIATAINDCNLYLDEDLTNKITTVEKGTNLEILQDKTRKIYLVKNDNLNIKGFLKREDLYIPKTPVSNKERLKDKELETYINKLELDSETDFLVFTDIYRQLTYIFKGEYKNWRLIKTIPCGTGVNESPTTRGIFKISDKGEWFYSERLKSGAMFWLRFNNSYLYHSVSMDRNKNIIDKTIGERCSNGCVRMEIDDIKWFYENIEKGTTVYIN